MTVFLKKSAIKRRLLSHTSSIIDDVAYSFKKSLLSSVKAFDITSALDTIIADDRPRNNYKGNRDNNRDNRHDGDKGSFKGRSGGGKEDNFGVDEHGLKIADKNNVIVFQYARKKSGRVVTLKVNYREANPKIKTIQGFRRFTNPTNTNPDFKSPTFNSRVKVSKDEKGLTLHLEIHPKDYFALRLDPHGSNTYQLFSPYLGHQFYFVVRDTNTIRFSKFIDHIGNVDRNNPFSLLFENSTPLSPLENTFPFLRAAISQFKTVDEKIYNELKEGRDRLIEKRNNFKFRQGDVITNFNGTNRNWMIARTLWNPKDKTFYYILVLDEEDSLLASGIDLEKNSVIQPVPYTGKADPITYYKDVKYVRTVPENIKNKVYNELEPKIDQISTIMGLTDKHIIKDDARDLSKELPPKTEEKDKTDNEGKLNRGKIFYVKELPSYPTDIFVPISDAELNTKIAELQNSTDINKQEKIDKLRLEHRTGSTTQRQLIKFPNSEGWYLVVDRESLKNSDAIRWVIMPYPRNRMISADIPIPSLRNTSPITTSPGTAPLSRLPNQNNTTITRKIIEYNYVTLDLPSVGPTSLEAYVTEFSKENEYIGLRTLKDKKIVDEAVKYVEKRDISGNLRRIEPGDVVEYNKIRYYVANRVEQSRQVKYLIAPLAAFLDLRASSFHGPIVIKAGGTPAIGYSSIQKPADGDKSFDREAHKIATADALRNTDITKLFLNLYSNYNPDGTPRDRPKDISKITIDQSRPEGFRRVDDIGLDPSLQNKPSNNPETKTVNEGYGDITRDKQTQTKIKQAYHSGQLKLGSIFKYTWPDGRTSYEILYEFIDENQIRIVPGYFGYKGIPTGIVPNKGFADFISYGNIRAPGFWNNYYEDFYQNNQIFNFNFPTNFEDEFKRVLKDSGTKLEIPQTQTRKAEEDKLSTVETRKNLKIEEQTKYADNFVKKFNGSDFIGTVVEYERDGNILRSVVSKSTFIGEGIEISPLYKIVVYPDAQNHGRVQVPIMDIVSIISPNDIDPNADKPENVNFHNKMKMDFAQAIKSQNYMPEAVKDYYQDN